MTAARAGRSALATAGRCRTRRRRRWPVRRGLDGRVRHRLDPLRRQVHVDQELQLEPTVTSCSSLSHAGVGPRLADVVALKLRIGGQHLVGVVAGGQQSHDGSNRHAKPSNAQAAAHDVRILCDAVQSGHGSSIGVRWLRVTGGGARNPALAALRGCPSIMSTLFAVGRGAARNRGSVLTSCAAWRRSVIPVSE